MDKLKKVIKEENDIIGNLKGQFIKNSLRAQTKVSINAGEVAGNTALGYHRGLAWGRAQATRDIVRILKSKFPKASEHIKTVLEYDYKYK